MKGTGRSKANSRKRTVRVESMKLGFKPRIGF